MNTIRVSASRAYDVLLSRGLFEQMAARILVRFGNAARAVIVSDDRVYPLYGEALRERLARGGMETTNYLFPHGERSKNLVIYADLLESLGAAGMGKEDVIIALGGGVTGDLAGFAAATYLRGVPLVQIPTTLLAGVDSSIGGKTAINLSGGKNQVGCISQPALVMVDPALFTTLSDQEFRNGCAEVIKCAVIGDKELFGDLPELSRENVPEDVVGACLRLKRGIVERDEFDDGERRVLNFGHTFGHAAEHLSDYTVPHGFAVAMGMATVTRAAEARGLCEEGTAKELETMLARFDLPTEIPFSAAEVADVVYADKKRRGAKLHLVIPERIGRCVVKELPMAEIDRWLADGGVR